MNSLFRNIKENSNLDFIEESGDEEDFEANILFSETPSSPVGASTIAERDIRRLHL